MKTFEFGEDRKFFVDVLCNGNEERFDKYYLKLFDFRDPQIKRKELNVLEAKKELLKEESTCQLKISTSCSANKNLQVEHLIPISSNKLNKKIRKIKALSGKKVLTQSFGSNLISNLVLACKKCNNIKKHKLPDVGVYKDFYSGALTGPGAHFGESDHSIRCKAITWGENAPVQ